MEGDINEIKKAIKKIFEEEKQEFENKIQNFITNFINKTIKGNIFPNSGLIKIKNEKTLNINNNLFIGDYSSYYFPLINGIFPSVELVNITKKNNATILNFFGELDELFLYTKDFVKILNKKTKFFLKIEDTESEIDYNWPFQNITVKEFFQAIFFPESFCFLKLKLPKIKNKIKFSIIIYEDFNDFNIGLLPISGIYEDIIHTNQNEFLLPEDTLYVEEVRNDFNSCDFHYLSNNLLEIKNKEKNVKIKLKKISKMSESISFAKGEAEAVWFYKIKQKFIIDDINKAIKFLNLFYKRNSVDDFLEFISIFININIISVKKEFLIEPISIKFENFSRMIPTLIEKSFVEINEEEKLVTLFVFKKYFENFNVFTSFKIGNFNV